MVKRVPAVGDPTAGTASSRDVPPEGIALWDRQRPAALPGERPWVGYVYVLPALLLYVAFVIVPIGASAVLSLFRWDGENSPVWVGFSNYRLVFTDQVLRSSLIHPAILLIFYCVLPLVCALVLSTALTNIKRGQAAFRLIIFLPFVVPGVVAALMWQFMYEPATGLINDVLRGVGLGSLARPWLGSFSLALPAVGVVGTWALTGLVTVFLVAGLQKIPIDLYDAARVDGAGAVQQFLAVTFPGLRQEITVALVITAIAALRNFDIIYNLTQGGPGYSTVVPAYEVYNQAFVDGSVGSACALAVVLAVVIFVLIFIITRITEWRA